MASLEGWSSTIELHPLNSRCVRWPTKTGPRRAGPGLPSPGPGRNLALSSQRNGGGGGRIRTYVDVRQQIYSLPPLTTRPPLQLSVIILVFCLQWPALHHRLHPRRAHRRLGKHQRPGRPGRAGPHVLPSTVRDCNGLQRMYMGYRCRFAQAALPRYSPFEHAGVQLDGPVVLNGTDYPQAAGHRGGVAGCATGVNTKGCGLPASAAEPGTIGNGSTVAAAGSCGADCAIAGGPPATTARTIIAATRIMTSAYAACPARLDCDLIRSGPGRFCR